MPRMHERRPGSWKRTLYPNMALRTGCDGMQKHKCNLHRAEFYNGYYSLGTKLDSDEESYAEAEHFIKSGLVL